MASQISLGLERHFNEFEIGEAAAAGVHTVRDHEQHRSVRVGKRGGQTGRIVPCMQILNFGLRDRWSWRTDL
jgi:hypothetical protein